MKGDWGKGYIEWWEGKTFNISVVFSWQMEKAVSRMGQAQKEGVDVKIGGPATGRFESNGEVVFRHNPNATFTSRGCIRKCEFCIVLKVEGELRELSSWIPRPTVCDNNLLACLRNHFNKVIDSLKPLSNIDFNQGLDARLLHKWQVSRLTELKLRCIRLAWDFTKDEDKFMDACQIILDNGFPRSRIWVYVLIGFNDTPEDALYRLKTIWNMGMFPFPMRYQPIDTSKRNSFVGEHWIHSELVRYMRYWANLRITSPIPFEEFQNVSREKLIDC